MIKQLFRRFSDGKLVAKDDSYASIVPVQYIQSTPSNNWVLNHNNNSTKILLNVFINDQLILDQTFNIIDSNNIEIPFSEEVSGFANILFFR